MYTRIEEQKWFYLTLGIVVLINLFLLLGKVSYGGYAKLLMLFVVFISACFILHRKIFAFVFYILLLFSIILQALKIPSSISVGGLDIYIYDILTGGVFT